MQAQVVVNSGFWQQKVFREKLFLNMVCLNEPNIACFCGGGASRPTHDMHTLRHIYCVVFTAKNSNRRKRNSGQYTIIWMLSSFTLKNTAIWCTCTPNNTTIRCVYSTPNTAVRCIYTLNNTAIWYMYTLNNTEIWCMYTLNNTVLWLVYNLNANTL